jgi:hypothetical protein
MATELAVVQQPVREGLTIEQLKYRQQQIHKLLTEVLKEGIDDDYAEIPGTKKKSLLKPGAEKICNLFQFVPTISKVEEFREGDDVTFRVTVALSTASGNLLGEGIGQASTKETKFAWRKAVCEEEWEDAEPSERRRKWFVDKYNGGAADIILQVRENPADKENNMLKIGKKRALIDAVLTVTGSSNLFTQDREDDTEGGNGNSGPRKQASAQSSAKKAAPADQGAIVEPKQAGRFYFIWSKDRNPPRAPEEVKLYLQRKCGVSDSRQMPTKFYAEACRWAASNEPVPDAAPATAEAQPKQDEAEKKGAPSPEQAEADTAFGMLAWDEKKRARFVEQYAGDWTKILGELKILIAKRKDEF